MKNVHFAIPEIYGESLSYYELLRKLVNKTNELIENYNTVPEQIAEEVANLDASQLFSEVLNELINSIATDNTKSANAVKVYKKHDLLYATFNDTVNLYESLIDFTTGTETELIVGSNIREVNISELLIELRKLIEDETQVREHADNGLQTNIDNEAQAREQADATKVNKSDVLTLEEIQASTDLTGKVASASALNHLNKYKLNGRKISFDQEEANKILSFSGNAFTRIIAGVVVIAGQSNITDLIPFTFEGIGTYQELSTQKVHVCDNSYGIVGRENCKVYIPGGIYGGWGTISIFLLYDTLNVSISNA